MKFFLAAYDPAQQTSSGQYWVWWHDDLSEELRNTFYYEVAAKNLPRDANALSPIDCYGGWASVNDQWACWYRFYDGGRDGRGRPGRFVLLCAFCRRHDQIDLNRFGVLRSQTFQDFAIVSTSTLPQPPELRELDFEGVELAPSPKSSSAVPLGERVMFTDAGAEEQAARACANLPPVHRFRCAIDRRGDQLKIVVEIFAADSTDRPPKLVYPNSPSEHPRSSLEHASETAAIIDRGGYVLRSIFLCILGYRAIIMIFVLCAIAAIVGSRYFGEQPILSESEARIAPGIHEVVHGDVRQPMGSLNNSPATTNAVREQLVVATQPSKGHLRVAKIAEKSQVQHD